MAKDVKISLDADTTAYNQKLKKANEDAKKIGKTHKDARKELEKQIPILGKINSGTLGIAASAAGVALVVGGIAKAWQDAEAAADSAANKLSGLVNSGKNLATVGGSVEGTVELEKKARLLAASGGISIEQASQAVFDLASAGNLDQFSTVMKASLTDSDIVGSIAGGQKSAAAFGGTLSTSLQRLAKGASVSPFSSSQISSAVAVGGATFAAAGGSEAEFIASIGGAKSAKSADVAGNKLKSFAAAVNNDKQVALRKFRSPGDSPVDVARKLWQHMQDNDIGLDQVGRFITGLEAQDGFSILVENFRSGSFDERIESVQNPGDALQGFANNRTPFTKISQQKRTAEAINFNANISAGVSELEQQVEEINRNTETALVNERFGGFLGLGTSLKNLGANFIADTFNMVSNDFEGREAEMRRGQALGDEAVNRTIASKLTEIAGSSKQTADATANRAARRSKD